MKDLMEKIALIDELQGNLSHADEMHKDKLQHLEARLQDAKKELKQANEKYASLFDSALKKKEND